MLNEVRRKPEKPRIRKLPGLGYECVGAGISSLAYSRSAAFREWKEHYDWHVKPRPQGHKLKE